MSQDASTVEAARHFGVTTETVRCWIRAGAPCVSPGEVGRGHSARLNLEDVARWRAAKAGIIPGPDDVMTRIETALMDVVRRDGGNGAPIAQQLGIPADTAAEFLAHVHSRIRRALTGGG